MMNKQQFTEIAKKVLHPNNGLVSPKLIHPGREWLIGVTVAAVIFGVIAAWSAQMYLEYKDTTVAEVTETEVAVYRTALVNSALDDFSVRTDKHEDFISINLIEKDPIAPEVDDLNIASTTDIEIETASSSVEVREEGGVEEVDAVVEEVVDGDLEIE